jgi:hypothetical protein
MAGMTATVKYLCDQRASVAQQNNVSLFLEVFLKIIYVDLKCK